MEELKQCPFCGNRAYLFTTDELGYSEKDRYTVKCGSCFCGTGQYADQERAKEAWNRRTVPSQNCFFHRNHSFFFSYLSYRRSGITLIVVVFHRLLLKSSYHIKIVI